MADQPTPRTAREAVTVTVRNLGGWDLRDHIEHLLEIEGWNAKVTRG